MPMPRREEHDCRACVIVAEGYHSAGLAVEWRCCMNRLALLLLYCAAWAAPYARADDAAAMAVLRAGCTADVQRLCANVQPGGGRILACLREHKDALSDQCQQAAQRVASMSGNTTPSNPPNAPPPPGPPPSAPAQPAPQAVAPSPAHHAASGGSGGSGSYLLLKKAQIMTTTDDHPGEALWPAIEMLIPSTWDFKGSVGMYGGKTGCFSESFSVIWEAKSPDGVTKFAGIPNYAWQYSDDPQELHNLTDPNRRTHTGGKTNDLCAVGKPLNAEQYFRQRVLTDLRPAMTVESVEALLPRSKLTRAAAHWDCRPLTPATAAPASMLHPRTAWVSTGRQADGTLVLPGTRHPDLSRRPRISLRYPRRRPSGVGRAQGQARWQRKSCSRWWREFHSTHASAIQPIRTSGSQVTTKSRPIKRPPWTGSRPTSTNSSPKRISK